MSVNKAHIQSFFMELQDQICTSLEKIDTKAVFKQDLWNREGGGGGRTRIIQNGHVFEKGGVNFSAVHGILPENIKHALKIEASDFFATGISIVIHPQNPFVPIIHMNTRYFEVGENTYWFGGGIDLTPHYVIKQDAQFFHKSLQKVCDEFKQDAYGAFKQWADEYFYIKHRKETRGVGGIFFDRLSANTKHTKQDVFEFVKLVGQAFVPIYSELVKRNKDTPFGKNQKDWQYLRRGRYVEFNLVYDKGTKFGLDTSGRIESILMSLPSTAKWFYDFKPQPNSKEAQTLNLLKKEVDWVGI